MDWKYTLVIRGRIIEFVAIQRWDQGVAGGTYRHWARFKGSRLRQSRGVRAAAFAAIIEPGERRKLTRPRIQHVVQRIAEKIPGKHQCPRHESGRQ